MKALLSGLVAALVAFPGTAAVCADDLSTAFTVDADWPQRPAAMQWGQMPGITVDRNDNVWLFTRAVQPVQAYEADGKFIRAWGSDIIGRAHHIRIDGHGNVWVTDLDQHVVMQCSPEGKLLMMLGTRGEIGEDERHFFKPTDIAVTPEGEIFISDGYGNSRVVHFDKQGRYVKAWGKRGNEPGQFDTPHGIALDSLGRLYVADRGNARVQVFDQSGHFLDQWTDEMIPWGVWITPSDEVWVCGTSVTSIRNERGELGLPPPDQVVARFAPSGELRDRWSVVKSKDGQEKPGEVNWVHCIALDSSGNLYLGDIMGKRAQKFLRRK